MAVWSLFRRSFRFYHSAALLRRNAIFSSSYLAHSSRPSPLLIRGATPLGTKPPSSLLFLRLASSKLSVDDNLERVLDSEIQCAQESNIHGQEIDLPNKFPFEIVDNPGDQTVILKRVFAGENIEVAVLMNFDEQNDLEESERDEEDNESDERSMQPSISLVVNIDKGEGSLLEFCCNLNSEELEIDSMVIKKRGDLDDQGAYQGPEFSDLDENLQKALHKYLEVRGIKSSLFDFLHQYMLHKDEREYLAWLQNIKKFVAK